jgi:protein sidekick
MVQIAAVGVYTEGAKIKTKGVPEALPVNIRIKAINSTAIKIWWKPPNPQQINGINQGYKIQAWRRESSIMVSGGVSGNEEQNIAAKMITVPPSLLDSLAEQQAILAGLEKFKNYNITVLCFTDPGEGVIR